MIEKIESFDKQLLLWLNGKHSSFFDHFMFFVSDKYVWIPLYILLAGIIVWKYRRNSIWIFIAVTVLIILSDQLANVLKDNVKRFRPCKDPEIGYLVHIVNNYCRSSYGFVSGHAANSFALATFLSFLFKRNSVKAGLIIWATVVSYSRVYLGVHYPGDILGGALLGILLGWGVFMSLNKITRITITSPV